MRSHHVLLSGVLSSLVAMGCSANSGTDLGAGGGGGSSSNGTAGSTNGATSGSAGDGASGGAGGSAGDAGGSSGSSGVSGTSSVGTSGAAQGGTGGAGGTSSGGTAGMSQGGSGGAAGTSTNGVSGSNGTAGAAGTCSVGTADCNNDPSDGCEVNTHTDPDHCGTCENVCSPVMGVSPLCSVGECDLQCGTNVGNCNGNLADGCEANFLDDPANCGGCGTSCLGQPCVDGNCICGAETHSAAQIPLDLFVMLDQSASMSDSVSGGTKWSTVTAALKSFLNNPANADLSVGIQYFALTGASTCSPTCTTNADCGSFGPCFAGICFLCTAGPSESCNAADYSVAAVEIAPLNAAHVSDLNASINAHSPTTNTPTAPALDGAIQHAKAWKTQHPGHEVVVVFATDGDPSECDPQDIPSIANIAAAGVSGTPSIKSFVIGVGSSLTSLNAIAAGGGTGSAYIVDTNGNVGAQFQAALNAIQSGALGCEYTIPAPSMGTIDYSLVNVQYTPSGGSPVLISNVANAAACDPATGGWYYDNNQMPSKITICDPLCGQITTQMTGQVDVLLGCATKHDG